jgi:uncharacterized protein YqgQ
MTAKFKDRTKLEFMIKDEIFKVYAYDASVLIPEHNCEIAVYETVAKELVATIKQNVLKKTTFVKRETGPSSVWQHIKRDWLPSWVAKLYPVEMNWELLEVNEIYPHRLIDKKTLGNGYLTVVRTELTDPH